MLYIRLGILSLHVIYMSDIMIGNTFVLLYKGSAWQAILTMHVPLMFVFDEGVSSRLVVEFVRRDFDLK